MSDARPRRARSPRRAGDGPDLLRSLVVAGLVALGLAWLRLTGALQQAELAAYDELIDLASHHAAGRERERRADVAILSLSEDELREHGHPIPDAVLADAIQRLRALGARAIGVDLYRDRPVPPGHASLESITAGDPRVVFVEKISDPIDRGVAAPSFATPPQIGASDLLPDRDGVVRRALLYLWDEQGATHLAFGLRVALAVLAADRPPAAMRPDGPADAERRPLRLGRGRLERFLGDDGPWRAADDGDHQILLDHRRAAVGYQRFSLTALLDGRVPQEAVRDRAVLIGTLATSVRDDFLIPGGTLSGGPQAVRGVEIHAALVDQLLRVARDGEAPLRFASERGEAIAIVGAGLLGGVIAHVATAPLALFALPLGVGFAAVVLAVLLFLNGLLLPVLPLVTSLLFCGAATQARLRIAESRARRSIERLLVPHVSERVRDVLFAHRRALLHGEPLPPRRAFATVLFADVAGWSEIADHLSPERALAWLGAVLGPVVTAVEEAGGTVEDFAGDGIKACFGAFEEEPGDDARGRAALAAVRCAERIVRALGVVDARLREKGLSPARLRLGLHAGEVVVGSVGSTSRLKLASVGSTVNVAARIERLGHDHGEVPAMPPSCDRSVLPDADTEPCRVLLSDGVVALLDAAAREALPLRDLGAWRLRGIDTPVRVWQLALSLVLLLLLDRPAQAEWLSAGEIEGRARIAAADAPPPVPADASPTDARETAPHERSPAAPPPAEPAPASSTAKTPASPTPYVPPPTAQRVSWRRVGGATRGRADCGTTVTAFVPAEHAGLTVRAAPTLVFALDRPTSCPIEIVVNDPRALAPVVEVRLPGPFAAGVHRHVLRPSDLVMEPGLTYTWFVQVISDERARSADLVAGGGVRRIVDAAAGPADAGAGAALLARGLEMARASLWYDAVADLSGAASQHVDGARDALAAVLAAEGLSVAP